MPVIAADAKSNRWLICRAGSRLCALPVESVIEIMRLLPIEPLAGAPPFVRGLCIHRGVPVPVVDAGLLFGECSQEPERLVAIRVAGGVIGVAFTSVVGLRRVEADAASALPPLLQEAAGDVITAIATLDAELLHVLNAGRMAPDWVLEGQAAGQASL